MVKHTADLSKARTVAAVLAFCPAPIIFRVPSWDFQKKQQRVNWTMTGCISTR
jgi:hypothetical protein